jgi:hypothetical protein
MRHRRVTLNCPIYHDQLDKRGMPKLAQVRIELTDAAKDALAKPCCAGSSRCKESGIADYIWRSALKDTLYDALRTDA